jgi:L-threonylcarbamoyladenylate synthase
MESRPVDAAAIARAVEVLKRGGLIAMPTETVYGLAADAHNDAAVRAIFAAKGRPADHPVIVHLPDAAAMTSWASEVPDAALALVAAFWPGPLTIVLTRGDGVSDLITGGQDTIGLRCPAHPWAQALLKAFGGGLAAPSANRFGHISPTTAWHVVEDLGVKPDGAVDLVLDGGACPLGIESTIVDLTADAPRLLRPGVVTRDQLERVLGRSVAGADAGAPRVSGALEKHYAPRTPLELVPVAAVAARMAACAPRSVAVLAPDWAVKGAANLRLLIVAADRPSDYARTLYENLRRLDASGAAQLIVAEPPDRTEWEAVRDRLTRAAAGSAA